ncbi:hypothetical protein [Nostoc linckia]|uniref:hypothetical protein n=1 Tax=Nostoc linckia TaxID=92942 RepID=UPI00117DC02D|nr:hypothetical protein [Nostoc linckia]
MTTSAMERTPTASAPTGIRLRRLRSVTYWSLVGVTAFQAVSALAGGVAMLATDGLGMPVTFLESGLFTSFLIPGLILLFVLGGTQTLATVLLVARRESALLWTAVAGFGVMIWIYVETAMIAGSSFLQDLYFATGTVQLVLVLALLGVAGWLPRAPLRQGSPD